MQKYGFFGDLVQITEREHVMMETIDGWMDRVDSDAREAMTRTFLEALLYEYVLWDYGYNGDTKDYSDVTRLEDWL